MKPMDAEEISSTLSPFLAEAGLVPVSVAVKPSEDLGFENFPVVDVLLSLEKTTPSQIAARAINLEKAFNKTFGCEIRTGYYSPDIGYDDIPAGHAMVQIDLLPFKLEPTRAPGM